MVYRERVGAISMLIKRGGGGVKNLKIKNADFLPRVLVSLNNIITQVFCVYK